MIFWENNRDQKTLVPTNQMKEIEDPDNRIRKEQGNIITDAKEI